MATYLPGVIPFVPQTQVFTPDYKFLQDVLSTRQDRYDTNFKEINKLYGQVVYAPLSREKSKNKRDQYANALTNSLKQVAGMDLSLAQNVETAKALFTPFYKDTDLVRDMFATKTFRKSQKEIEFLKNANNRDYSRQYWSDGEKYVNYMMEEFTNGTDEQARKFNVGKLKYQKNPDIFNRAMEILDESGLEGITQDHIIKDYIVRIKNGPAMTNHQFTYIDPEDGKKKTGTQNLALDYVVQALADDPKIQQGMGIKYEVQKIEFQKKHEKEFGGLYQAGLEFDKKELLKSKDEDLRKLAEINTQLKGDQYALSNWEDYKQTYGIVTGSKEDDALMKKQYEVMLASETKRRLNDRLNNIYAPTDSERNLSNKARLAFISSNMKSSFYGAANAYASKKMSTEYTVDQAQQTDKKLRWEKEKFNAKQMQDWSLKMMELENERIIAGSETAVGELLSKYNTSFNQNPSSPLSNVDNMIYTELNNQFRETQDTKAQSIFHAYQSSLEFRKYLFGDHIEGKPQDDMDGWFNVGSDDKPDWKRLNDAMAWLKLPENEETLNRIYTDIESKWATFDDDTHLNDFIPLDEIDFDEKVLSEMKNYFDLVEASVSGADGTPLNTLDIYNNDFATAFNYFVKNNPDSEMARNSYSGFSFPVVNEYWADLENIGISTAILSLGPDDVIPGTNMKAWGKDGYIETRARKSGLLDGIYNDEGVANYGSGVDSFRDLVLASPLIRRNPNSLTEATITSLVGQPIYGENGDIVVDAETAMVSYLHQEYPKGPDNAGRTSGLTFWENPKFSNNGWSENGTPGLFLRQMLFKFDSDNNNWWFDSEAATQMIVNKSGYYSQVLDGINNTWLDEGAIPGGTKPYPTVLSHVFPHQEINFGPDMFSAYISNTIVGTNLIYDQDAANNLEGAFHAYSQIGHGNGIILQGDYLTKEAGDETLSDPMADAFYRDILLLKMNDAEWLKKNNIGLQWSQISPTTYVDETDGETKNYSAYKFTVPAKLITENKDYKPGDSEKTLENSDIGEEQSITILVRQDLDALVNEKHMTNQTPSIYENIINFNGEYSNEVGGGGRVKYYKNHNGEIVQSLTPYKWDNESSSYVNDPNYLETIIDPATLEEVVNMTNETLIINRENNKNVRNGTNNLEYNTNNSGVYQEYPGGPYLVK